ncbi:MAG: 4Fe-4S binding protein [Christensenellaceae bacterium]|nr:4Fe-4S binding protein [Christensenellaceae bacterium]
MIWAALSNGYAIGFAKGKIYQGPGKYLCLPGLNCYSCPGALGSCPMGSLQNAIAGKEGGFAFYVVGILLFFGVALGRFICGWLCPFGWVQDLLYKIPLLKKWKRKKLPGDKWLKWLKFAILAGFVILLPMLVLDVVGRGSPWFCKYICPSGTLFGGIPLIAANPPLQQVLGWLFTWKAALLIGLCLLSIWVYRPFCRYLCPLGAFYGVCNKVSLYGFKVDEHKCTDCGICKKVCKLDIPVNKIPNSIECIRCGDCRKACPEGAISLLLERRKKTQKKEEK